MSPFAISYIYFESIFDTFLMNSNVNKDEERHTSPHQEEDHSNLSLLEAPPPVLLHGRERSDSFFSASSNQDAKMLALDNFNFETTEEDGIKKHSEEQEKQMVLEPIPLGPDGVRKVASEVSFAEFCSNVFHSHGAELDRDTLFFALSPLLQKSSPDNKDTDVARKDEKDHHDGYQYHRNKKKVILKENLLDCTEKSKDFLHHHHQQKFSLQSHHKQNEIFSQHKKNRNHKETLPSSEADTNNHLKRKHSSSIPDNDTSTSRNKTSTSSQFSAVLPPASTKRQRLFLENRLVTTSKNRIDFVPYRPDIPGDNDEQSIDNSVFNAVVEPNMSSNQYQKMEEHQEEQQKRCTNKPNSVLLAKGGRAGISTNAYSSKSTKDLAAGTGAGTIGGGDIDGDGDNAGDGTSVSPNFDCMVKDDHNENQKEEQQHDDYRYNDTAASTSGTRRQEKQHSIKKQEEEESDSGDDDDEGESDTDARFQRSQSKKWANRFEELVAYKAKHGHCLIPHNFSENLALAKWVKRQRYQYKLKQTNERRSTLTNERQDALENIGFVWDSHKAGWMERFESLKQFLSKYGHCSVPSNYIDHSLAVWVKIQRRQYKLRQTGSRSTMTDERLALLEQVGFDFNPRNL